MNINEIYDRLSIKGSINNGDSVKVRTGMFNENDLIRIFTGLDELDFKIDRQGLMEIMNNLLPKIQQLPNENSFTHMIEMFKLLEGEINSYYGTSSKGDVERLQFYMVNGIKIDDECRVCSMSQIKGKGIAKCAEKAALANNILLILNSMGLFDYKVNYVEALCSLNNGIPEGHAFLEFDRVNAKGKNTHIIYDITNPEIILYNGEKGFYPAVYSLNDDEYKSFLEGNYFDNSKFIVFEYYQLKETRKYCGFKINEYEDDFQEISDKNKKIK